MSIIRWADLREEEFEEAIKKTDGVCVIPVGCYEKHGQHLPVGTDVYEAVALAEKAAELEPICIFPAYEFGDISGYAGSAMKGGIMFDTDLMFRILDAFCLEISRNGFNKIVLLNFHGGNLTLINQYLKTVLQRKQDFIVSTIFPAAIYECSFESIHKTLIEKGSGYYPELLPVDEAVIKTFVEEEKTDGHGGLYETSLMLAIRPDTVRLDRMNAESGLSTQKADKMYAAGMDFQGSWGLNFPNSYGGHAPVGASDRIGKLLLRLQSEAIANACRVFKEEYPVLKRAQDERNKFYC